ncbi:hypothetical protein GCK32_001407 [Trichostrongylus colubriformis]|uniref:Uncharacterized protein n=1 Tax=Trichostrongylus colubriformis TaxID=6319 RepID=A0AAN8IGN8_TRICO
MIGVLLLPLCLARSPNGTRRCLDGKSYMFYDDPGRPPIDTSECCTGFSKDEDGNCVADIIRHSLPTSALPRFAAAISLILVVWILIAVFSLVIAYVTMMGRNRKKPRNSSEIGDHVASKVLLNNDLPSKSQLVMI